MIVINHLYTKIDILEDELKKNQIDKIDQVLIQIFTSDLAPPDALALAKKIKTIMPNAKIIGTSVCGVIYNCNQYEGRTLIVIEKFNNADIFTNIMNWENKNPIHLVNEISNSFISYSPPFMRIFFGGYYDYTHQFIDEFNRSIPYTQLVGGMAGEITTATINPFVFTENTIIEKGIVSAVIYSEKLEVFSRVNNAHEPISPIYSITKTDGRAICEIENEPAYDWLQKKLGGLSKKQYSSWEEIAKNDPLVRFQLVLEGHNGVSRFIRYDENEKEISQYYSRLDPNTQFRLSYTSPSKCVEECQEICLDIAQYPIEQLFCYSCLFRKLYLENCAKWELLPFKSYNICGVFMLGEVAYINGTNELLNGSCVFSGIAEEEKYIIPNMDVFEDLYKIETENIELLDFVLKKQSLGLENVALLENVHKKEKSYQTFWGIDQHLEMNNLLRYEKDKKKLLFDKICLIKIENAEALISCIGQEKYFDYIKTIKPRIFKYLQEQSLDELLHIYAINFDTFIFATNKNINENNFIEISKKMYEKFKFLQIDTSYLPLIGQFVVVHDQKNLLERAYNTLQISKYSQVPFIVCDNNINTLDVIKDELKIIQVINYALQHDGIIPYYQGIHNNENNKIEKYEALMRIIDKDNQVYSPYEFMEIAKKYKTYLELSEKMIDKVFNEFNGLDSTININLSAYDINSNRFREFIKAKLSSFLYPQNVVFEILEDECFRDITTLQTFIENIREYGAKVAIDDFGSGYSNLLEITKIMPDYIKIDGEIIRNIHKNSKNKDVLKTIVYLANKLDVCLVAEFVDNEEVQSYIKELGVSYSQGYYFAKPEPFEGLFNL